MDISKKQNILIVHNYYQIPGGEDTVVANEQKMLKDHGYKVILYSRNNSELKHMSKLKKLCLPFTTIFNPRTYREVKKLIRDEDVNIVHVHNTLNLISPAVYYAALKCKIPVVQTVHNFRLLCPGATFYRDGHICEDCVEYGLHCAVKHSCYRGSKAQTLICVLSTKIHRLTGIYERINYICLTDFNKKKLLSFEQIKPENVFVKPNFVETDIDIIPFDQRQDQYVFAGRLDKLKGIDVLFEAWKLMGTDAPKLIVCGIGPMEEWCKQYVRENSLNVEMKGFVSNEETRQLIASSKAMILPTQWYEGFPMSIAEAFSVGTPVIGSNMGNVGSLIKDKFTGIKIQCETPVELQKAVNRIENNTDIYETTIKEYKSLYTAKKNYETMNYIYQSVLERD